MNFQYQGMIDDHEVLTSKHDYPYLAAQEALAMIRSLGIFKTKEVEAAMAKLNLIEIK